LNAEEVMNIRGSDALERLKAFIAGSLAAQQGQWQQAYQLWQKASGLFNGFSLAGLNPQELQNNLKDAEFKYIIMGLICSSQRLDMAAIKQFQQALQVNSGSIWSNYLIAQIYQQIGDKAKAVSHFEASLSQAPQFLAALIALGDIGFSTQDAQLATLYYSKALALKSDHMLIYRLGSVYEATGELSKAEMQYQKIVDEHPKMFLGYNQLAWFYAKQGIKLDKALDLAKKADQLQPNNPLILDTLGWIFFQKKDYKNAEQHLKRAIEKTDQIPTILYHYGAVLRAAGDEEKAKSFMRKALNITDQFDGADDAKAFIQKEKKSG
jgi:tetratricopeptide (TPR) repeat protein